MDAVVITFDCLPSHRLGCYGALSARTPHCDWLASESVVFMRHYAAWTGEPFRGEPWWSVDPRAAIRGRGVGEQHRLADNEAIQGLRDRGILTTSFVERLPRHRRPWARAFETSNEPCDEAPRAPDRETRWQRLARDAAAALRELRRQERRPWLFWVQASGLDESATTGDSPRDVPPSDVPQGDVPQWDDGLGRLLAAVDEGKPNEQTLLIVVVGRGSLASPRGDVPPAYVPLLSEVAQVPLFVRLPASKGGYRVQEPVTTTDLWPTLFGWFGLDPQRPSAPAEPTHRGWLATIHGAAAPDRNTEPVRAAAANREIVTSAGSAAALRNSDRVTWAMSAEPISDDDAAGGDAAVAPAPRAFYKPEDLWETLDRSASIPEACDADAHRLRLLAQP